MKKHLNTIINVAFAVVVAAYIVAAVMMLDQKTEEQVCAEIVFDISESNNYQFVTDTEARTWIVTDTAINPIGKQLRGEDLYKIEQTLNNRPFVDLAQASKRMDGSLSIYIRQCEPLIRVMSDSGHDFYVDSAAKVLPTSPSFKKRVPTINGDFAFGFDNDYYGFLDEKNNGSDKENLKKLTNFVRYVYSDELLTELVGQIYIDRLGEIEIIPRFGDQVILLGEMEEYQKKLEKLKKFYRVAITQEWWEQTRTINLKFNNQVVTTSAPKRKPEPKSEQTESQS